MTRFFDDPEEEAAIFAELDAARNRHAALVASANEAVARRVAGNHTTAPWMPGNVKLALAKAGHDEASPVTQAAAQGAAKRKSSKGFGWGAIGDVVTAAGSAVGEAVKDTARVAFTAAAAPLEEVQGLARGTIKTVADGGSFADNVSKAGGSSLRLAIGDLIDGKRVDLGDGFFAGGEIAKEQERLARRLKVNGQWISVGRTLANVVAEPGSTEYKVLSGLVDAAVAIAADPASFAGGALAKTSKANKLFVGSADLAPRTRKLAEAAGLVNGRTQTVVRDVVAEWLGSAEASKVIRAFAETDNIAELRRLTGKKIPVSILREMADISDETAVRAALEPHLGIAIREKPTVNSFGVRVNKALDGVRLLQAMPGSHVDLDNLDDVVERMERFLLNAKVEREAIDGHINRLARTEGRIDRYEAVDRILADVAGRLASTVDTGGIKKGAVVHAGDRNNFGKILNVSDDGESATVHFVADDGAEATVDLPVSQLTTREADRAARRMTRMFSDYRNELSKYFTDEVGNNVPVLGAVVDGSDTVLPSPHLFNEYINRALPLPDARAIRQMTSSYGRLLNRSGLTGVTPFLDVVMQDIWKPMVLLRGAWTVRVIGEEQVRMGAAGYNSVFRHPLSAIAMVVGSDKRSLEGLGGFERLRAGAANTIEAPARAVGLSGRGASGLTGEAFDRTVDEFAAAMSTKGGGWRDRVIRVGKRNVDRSEEDYAEALADEIAKLANDPVAKRVAGGWSPGDRVPALAGARQGTGGAVLEDIANGLTGNHVEDAKRWFWEGPGQLFRDQMAGGKWGRALADDAEAARLGERMGTGWTTAREVADAYIDSVFRRIQIKTSGHSDLLSAVATGRLGDRALTENGKLARSFVDRVQSLADEGVGPQTAVGDIGVLPTQTAGQKAGDKMNRAVDAMFAALMERPTNYLSRSSAFKQMYWERAAELIPFMDGASQQAALKAAREANLASKELDNLTRMAKRGLGDLTLEDADLVAKSFALDGTKKLLYDLSERSQFFDVFRHVFPFGEAWKEILTTWTRVGLVEGKGVPLRRAQQLVEGARGAGFFYTDPQTGEEMFNYPGSAQLMDALTGVPFPLQARVGGLNLIGSSVIPGVGPVVQMPMSKLLPNKPEYDWLRDILLPFGDPDTSNGIIESNFPPWFRNFQKWVTGANPETDRLFANTVADVQRYLVSTGEYSTRTEEDMRRLEVDSVRKARTLYGIRGAAQFFAPSAPRPLAQAAVDPENMDAIRQRYPELFDENRLFRGAVGVRHVAAELLLQDYRDMQARDYETAPFAFLDKYGDGALLFMQSKSRAITGALPDTEDANDWVRSHPDIVRDFPLVYGYFAPEGGERDLSALDRQFRSGEREALTPRQQVQLGNSRVAQMIYQQAKRRAGTSREGAEWLRNVRSLLVEEFPGFGVSLGLRERAKPPQVIAEFARAVKNPVIAETDTGKAVALYLQAREQAMESAKARGLAGFGAAKTAADIREWLRSVASGITVHYPSFGEVFDLALEREFTASDEPEELEVAA